MDNWDEVSYESKLNLVRSWIKKVMEGDKDWS